jgi:hypothetical protein
MEIGLGLTLETMAGLEGGTITPALLDDSIMGKGLSASRAVIATARGLLR